MTERKWAWVLSAPPTSNPFSLMFPPVWSSLITRIFSALIASHKFLGEVKKTYWLKMLYWRLKKGTRRCPFTVEMWGMPLSIGMCPTLIRFKDRCTGNNHQRYCKHFGLHRCTYVGFPQALVDQSPAQAPHWLAAGCGMCFQAIRIVYPLDKDPDTNRTESPP